MEAVSSNSFKVSYKKEIKMYPLYDCMCRDVVMRMLSRLDPLGTRQHKRNRLCRRKYRSKV